MGDWLNYQIFGNEAWRFGAVLILLIGVVVLYFLLRHLAGRLALPGVDKPKRREMMKVLLRLLKGVLPLLLIWATMRIFRLPPRIQSVIDTLFGAALLFFILYLTAKLVDLLIMILNERAERTASKLDDQLIPLLGKGLKGVVWGIGLLFFLQNVLHYNISSLLAGLGIGGLAFAFAAQDTIANIFGALMIFSDHPFMVGDAVIMEGFEGSIEAIGMRSTKVRTWDGTLVIIPNRTVASTNICNLAARPMRRTTFTIGLVYGTSTAKLEEALSILRDVMKNHPMTGQSRAYFNRFGDFSLNILVQHWCSTLDYELYLRSLEEINLAIKRRFEAAELEFAFPTQTLYLNPQEPLEQDSLSQESLAQRVHSQDEERNA
ncbi:mechanosensitive ion channel family protein [Candidatus Bipolaricaulota bacterium]|nr:mechanosensitive ion channel family protein [Candidatus Bipolaricaulota bacterium]